MPRRAPFASAQRSPRRASSRPVRPGAPSVPSRSGCPGAPFAPSGRPGTPAVTRAPCAPSSHAARSPRRAAPSMHHLLVYLQSPIIVACEKRGGDAPRGTLSRAESFIKAVLLKPPAPPYIPPMGFPCHRLLARSQKCSPFIKYQCIAIPGSYYPAEVLIMLGPLDKNFRHGHE